MNTSNDPTVETVIPPPGPQSTAAGTQNAKPAIAFLNSSTDAVLIVIISRILAAMAGNAAYPAPTPTLAMVAAAHAQFVSTVDALDRGRVAQIRRNNARAALVPLVRDLALYVQHACKGDLATLVASGFPAQKGRGQRAGVLDAPSQIALAKGRLTGQVRARCKAMRAAKSYQWRWATAQAPTAWVLCDPTTSSRYTIEGLVACTEYLVQVRAVGAKGASNWSESATVIAQ